MQGDSGVCARRGSGCAEPHFCFRTVGLVGRTDSRVACHGRHHDRRRSRGRGVANRDARREVVRSQPWRQHRAEGAECRVPLYRNYPREFHYQFFSARLPRGGNCLVCRSNTLVGLEGLPSGGHLVTAPYVSASASAHPRDDPGSPLVRDPVKPHVGLDVKFTPDADNAVDLTVKPDFSQVESDVAQICANERFALFFPEKRSPQRPPREQRTPLHVVRFGRTVIESRRDRM